MFTDWLKATKVLSQTEHTKKHILLAHSVYETFQTAFYIYNNITVCGQSQDKASNPDLQRDLPCISNVVLEAMDLNPSKGVRTGNHQS